MPILIDGISKEELESLLDNLAKRVIERLPQAPPPQQADTLLTQAEVCELLRCSKPTVIRWTQSGKLPVRRIGRRVLYSKNEVQKAIRGMK